MARRAFSSSSSTLPCKIEVSAAGAATLGVGAPLCVAAAWLAGGAASAGLLGAPAPCLSHQKAPPAASATATATATSSGNIRRGLLVSPPSASAAVSWGGNEAMLRSDRAGTGGGAAALLATAASIAPSSTA